MEATLLAPGVLLDRRVHHREKHFGDTTAANVWGTGFALIKLESSPFIGRNWRTKNALRYFLGNPSFGSGRNMATSSCFPTEQGAVSAATSRQRWTAAWHSTSWRPTAGRKEKMMQAFNCSAATGLFPPATLPTLRTPQIESLSIFISRQDPTQHTVTL